MHSMMKRLLVLAVGLFLVACTPSGLPKGNTDAGSPVPSPSEQALIDMTPAGIQSAAIKAAIAQRSVHSVGTATLGDLEFTVVNDTGATSGRKLLTLEGSRVEVLLVDRVVYFRANASLLKELLRLSSKGAAKYANKWLSVTETEGGFGELADTLDMPSLIAGITLEGDLVKIDPTTIEGRPVIGVRGHHPFGGTGTLYVSTEGDPLPVRFIIRAEDGSRGMLTFDDWGKKVSFKSPSESTSAAEIADAA